MKRFLIRGLTLFVITNAALLAGPVRADGVTRRAGAAQSARVGREFRVRAGRSVVFGGEDLRLRFVRVASDSRCPAGVTCVWAGNAEVLIEVSTKRGRARKVLRLNTNAGPERAGEGEYRRFTVRLVGLSPQPREGRRLSPREYTAALLVSKE